MGLIAELHADIEKEQILIRSLSFPGKCFPESWYIEIPDACDESNGTSPRNKPMLVSMTRLSLVDGKRIGEGPIVPARWVKNDQSADESVLHYSRAGLLRRMGRDREIEFRRGNKVHRWKAPAGQWVSDARIINSGDRLIIAHHRRRSSRVLLGTLMLWDPKRRRALQRITIRVPQKSYPRPRRHFRYEAMGVMSISPVRPRPIALSAPRPLRRPNDIRMAISRSGAVLGVYAFGDLFVYKVERGNRIKPVRRVKDLLYINKDSYFKEGDIEVSQNGRWIAYSGRGEYVRFVNVHSGSIKNVPVRFNAVDAWSHALPGKGRIVSVGFDPKVRGGVWISTFSLLGKYGSDRKATRYYVVEKGAVTQMPLKEVEPGATQWNIDKIAVTRSKVVLLAAGRVLVLDRATMALRGWIGAGADVDLGNSRGVSWFRP